MESSESDSTMQAHQQHQDTNSANLTIAQQDQPVKLTPEQEQEIQLKKKYPNPQKPGGSAFIQKMLHKGNKKYFDSGDYNMAKTKTKLLLNNNLVNNNLNSNNNNTVNDNTENNINLNNSNDVTLSPASTTHSDFNSSNQIIVDSQSGTPNAVSNLSTLNGVNETILTTNLNNSPNVNNLNASNNQFNTQNTTPLAGSPMMSNSKSSTSLLLTNQNYVNVTQSLPMSISSSSLHMLSSSTSHDKISATLQVINAEDIEIGSEIPTPECLPHRKHSIVQSKLATPRLSTS